MNTLVSIRHLAALLCALGIAALAQAQGLDVPPPPGPPRPLSLTVPTEQRLPNGLRVVLAERHGLPLVSAELLVLAGSEGDPPGEAGLASMMAGLLTKGTQHRGASELAQAAESLGGALESGAGWHRTSIGITVTVPQLDAALDLVSEVAREPAFSAVELDRLRTQALDELQVAYSRPGTLASLASQRLLFGAGAYGHPAGGTPASLQRIARDDLVALHRTSFRPDRAVLVLAGDLDSVKALELATRHFGGWAPPGETATVAAPQPNAELPQVAAVVDMPQAGQAAVIVAVPLAAPGPDRATAVVTNAVLGGGFSSRLNQEIRIRRGLSYSAGSSLDLRPAGGSLRAAVQTKNESAADVVALVQAQLDRLAATPVEPDELAARKATLIGEVSRSIETTAGLGGTVAALIVDGRPLSEMRTRIDALAAVSSADLQRYAAANFGVSGRRVVVAGQAARFLDALKKAEPTVVVVPEKRLDLDGGTGLAAP